MEMKTNDNVNVTITHDGCNVLGLVKLDQKNDIKIIAPCVNQLSHYRIFQSANLILEICHGSSLSLQIKLKQAIYQLKKNIVSPPPPIQLIKYNY